MTTALILILFSVGGMVLVHTTFETAMQNEEKEAVESNEMILRITQFVGVDGRWFDETELVSIFDKICKQDVIEYLQLTREEQSLYVYQKQEKIAEYVSQETAADVNQVQITYFDTEDGEKYLQTSTQFLLYSRYYQLHMVRNLTDIYHARAQQIDVLQQTFVVLFVVEVILSWILATFLTRSLRKLSTASKEIGAGNLSYRSKINSNDEIGMLSVEFDNMAEKLEHNITLLKESAEQKEQFMGAFTHEIKTPMTSIIGYADLLRTQKLKDRDKEDALNYIFSEAKRLENLSLKMLDLFVADKKELTLKECNPSKLTYYVAKHLRGTYEKYNIKLDVNAEEGLCLLDPDLFHTLLINLLDNARKAMEQGGIIRITVTMTEKGCVVSVADTGNGIPKEAMKHLTEAFFRVDKARARNNGSAGLGLALCDKIVQLHYGRIDFESTEGVGTVVTATLNGGRNEKQGE